MWANIITCRICSDGSVGAAVRAVTSACRFAIVYRFGHLLSTVAVAVVGKLFVSTNTLGGHIAPRPPGTMTMNHARSGIINAARTGSFDRCRQAQRFCIHRFGRR